MRNLLMATVLLASTACTSLPGSDDPGSRSPWRTPVAPTATSPATSATSSLVPLTDAARRWNLVVDRESASMASLQGDDDRVIVWSAPSGAVVVNGQRLSDVGIDSADGRLLLPRDLVNRVADMLGRNDRVVRTTPTWTPTPTAPSLVGRTIMVDAGHGGRDPGAPNAWGPPEKDINLDTALRLQRRLAGWGARVLMTRIADTFPSLDDRVATANRARPDLFVSLHSNSEPKGTASGFTIYAARSASAESVRVSNHLITALSAAGIPSRGLHREDFRVVKKTNMPALLIEMGFVTNPSEARQLSSSAYRQRLADAIARGIANAMSRPASIYSRAD
ncbi:MAG: N-acetylmuramoyl-L-alanine amidase family protein [Planctomycetota bacterium]|jgi:N-acetylmuramoyl-L-alanine amidase